MASLYSQGKDAETGLTRREREVLALMTDRKLTQLQVSEELGVTRQRVRQIVESLLRKGHTIEGAKLPRDMEMKLGQTVSAA